MPFSGEIKHMPKISSLKMDVNVLKVLTLGLDCALWVGSHIRAQRRS